MKRIRTALVGVVAAACMVTGTLSANADPDAVAEAKSELARIQQESSALDQQIIEAFDAADKATAKLKTLKADLKAQEAKVDAGITELGDAAALQMGNDSVSLAAQLLTTSDSANFLSGLSAMQAEVDRSSAGVQQLQLEQAKLETLRTEAADTKAEADKQAKIAAERKRKAAEQAKLQKEMEAMMEQQLAAEANARSQAASAAAKGEVDKYAALIKATVERYMILDPTMRGKTCTIGVKLASSGFVISVDNGQGDPAVCRSGKAAVLKANQLPVPKDPAAFEMMKELSLQLAPKI